MDKIGVLITRLQEQYQKGADETFLLNTALLLVAELQYNRITEPAITAGKVSVIMPARPFEMVSNGYSAEEKIIEPDTQIVIEESIGLVDETLTEVMENNILPNADVEPETEQHIEPISLPEPEEIEQLQTSAVYMFAEEKYNDIIDEIPTLAQQQPKVVYELNNSLQQEETSLNDKLKQPQTEAGGRLQNEPIKDLRKAIGINDKYTFIRELFRNDEAAYERSLKTINGFSILPEAEYWMQREMKYKLGWDDSSATVKAFYQLVKRRFS